MAWPRAWDEPSARGKDGVLSDHTPEHQTASAGPRGRRRVLTLAASVLTLAWVHTQTRAQTPAQAPTAGAPAGRAAERAGGAVRTITWEDLVPKGWDPMAPFRERNLLTIREGSAAEREMMRELREIWDRAPTREDLRGQRLRLPGYVVPLDLVGDRLKEFLLVPYFGACIHSPPPPANQIVHVSLRKPEALRTMDVVWVSGTMSIERQDTAMGVSGYALAADAVEPYKADKR